jgi:hypothetical protein
MRKAVLPILAMLSLLFMVLLLVGCFVRIALAAVFYNNTHGSEAVSVAFDGGRVGLDYWGAGVPTLHSTVAFAWDPPKIRMPDAKRLLWQFDVSSARTGGSGNTYRLVEFPVWIVILPCLISPILWLRRRMRTNNSRGFAVIAGGGRSEV